MVVHFRIAVALIVCLVASSPVVAQEKAKIFLGASSKTLGYALSGLRRKRVFSNNRAWTFSLFSCVGCR